jgi:molybdopterin-guanine dinucleotide biosynthesis protein A
LILAGGQSRRMGKDKAALRFGPESLLSLAVRSLSEVARPVVV